MMNPRISREGIEFIKQWEKFRPAVYVDQAGHPTIGYGHKIQKHETFTIISEADATELLKQDILPIEAFLRTRVFVELSQNELDALVSFIFNIGIPEFIESTALKLLNDAHYTLAANEFEKWVWITDPFTKQKKVSAGLVRRRRAEKLLFNSGEA